GGAKQGVDDLGAGKIGLIGNIQSQQDADDNQNAGDDRLQRGMPAGATIEPEAGKIGEQCQQDAKGRDRQDLSQSIGHGLSLPERRTSTCISLAVNAKADRKSVV